MLEKEHLLTLMVVCKQREEKTRMDIPQNTFLKGRRLGSKASILHLILNFHTRNPKFQIRNNENKFPALITCKQNSIGLVFSK